MKNVIGYGKTVAKHMWDHQLTRKKNKNKLFKFGKSAKNTIAGHRSSIDEVMKNNNFNLSKVKGTITNKISVLKNDNSPIEGMNIFKR